MVPPSLLSADFRALFYAAPAPYLVVAPDAPLFTILEVNDAYLRATTTTRDGIVGRGLFDVFPDNPDDPDATGERNLRASLKAVISTRAPHAMAVQKYDIPKRGADQSGFEERYWSPINVPVFGSDGAIAFIIHHVEDVTALAVLAKLRDEDEDTQRDLRSRNEWLEAEIKRRTAAEAELRRAHDEAAAANRAKSEFLAVMSHELRTPLNAIAGYAELIETGVHGSITEEQREALHRLRRSQHHLLDLVDEVLNFAKLEGGHATYDIADVEVQPLFVEVTDLVAPQARAKQLRIDIEPCDPGFTVRADKEKLRQVLVNLLSNAIKFTDPPGVVAIQCQALGSSACIRVRDTGCGIPAEQIDKIFSPFVQLNRRLNRPVDGVGLGLAISRNLMRGMGGDLVADSQVGKGSVFTLNLKLGRAAADRA